MAAFFHIQTVLFAIFWLFRHFELFYNNGEARRSFFPRPIRMGYLPGRIYDMMRVMKKAPAFLPAMFTVLLMVFAMMPLTAGTVHAEVYNLWVGETRVTSENRSGDGWNYDPNTRTLTLENARIENAYSYNTDEDASIYSRDINLTIEVKGTNTIGTADVSCGIYAEKGSLTIKGNGTLNVGGKNRAILTEKDLKIPQTASVEVVATTNDGTITAGRNIEISGGTVKASLNNCCQCSAILASEDVKISGGTVDAMVQGDFCNAIYGKNVEISGGTVVAAASGGEHCYAVSSHYIVRVVGGVVTATAAAEDDEAFGIYSETMIEIANGAVLTSTGTSAALGGSVLCGTYGTGWTDVEGTGEGTDFTDELCNIDADLSDYKKVRFPLVKHTVTFKVVNGSWNDETAQDKSVTLKGYGNDVLKLADSDIPAVGSKPDDGYKVGSWDVTPSTETAITGNTTYKYTYALKDYTVTVNSGTGGGVYTKG